MSTANFFYCVNTKKKDAATIFVKQTATAF